MKYDENLAREQMLDEATAGCPMAAKLLDYASRQTHGDIGCAIEHAFDGMSDKALASWVQSQNGRIGERQKTADEVAATSVADARQGEHNAANAAFDDLKEVIAWRSFPRDMRTSSGGGDEGWTSDNYSSGWCQETQQFEEARLAAFLAMSPICEKYRLENPAEKQGDTVLTAKARLEEIAAWNKSQIEK